ncbi:MAG TPA: M28 family peptidase [Bryobacteraceae bacterium]|nr:M28 family peptidase [Bryobacteraceae bacterium]
MARKSARSTSVLIAALLCIAATPPLPPDQQAVLKHISAANLKAHLTYIASDALGGRATPSTGLDAAAEYIAGQFRRAGLEPAANGSYYQTASIMVREPNYDGFEATISSGVGRTRKVLQLAPADIFVTAGASLDVNDAPLVVLDGSTRPTPEQVDGRVVLITAQRPVPGLDKLNPVIVIRQAPELRATSQVFDPESRPPRNQVIVAKAELTAFVKGAQNLRFHLHAAASKDHLADVRNVAGILRGSDPTLKSTFVMLTAHYDHLGTAPESRTAPGSDRIFNGANDDGSGTVSVIEIAAALAAMPRHPARSILFMTFFGEERGLMGSAYYSRHPLVPLADTIADLNLEQLGRTDSDTGSQIKTASLTGFDFSDLPRILAEAAAPAGVKVYKDGKSSDPYFEDSDNLTLATMGIPAHTLCVAFQFPDYHKVTDSPDKIDYANMAAVDGAVSLGLLRLASKAPPPKWNESYAPAKRYAEAGKLLHP